MIIKSISRKFLGFFVFAVLFSWGCGGGGSGEKKPLPVVPVLTLLDVRAVSGDLEVGKEAQCITKEDCSTCECYAGEVKADLVRYDIEVLPNINLNAPLKDQKIKKMPVISVPPVADCVAGVLGCQVSFTVRDGIGRVSNVKIVEVMKNPEACTSTAQCPDGKTCQCPAGAQACADNQKMCLKPIVIKPECENDQECKDKYKNKAAVCDSDKQCVVTARPTPKLECAKDSDCKDPEKPVCNAETFVCEAKVVVPPKPECTADADCKDLSKPKCEANACRALAKGEECAVDAQCASGICYQPKVAGAKKICIDLGVVSGRATVNNPIVEGGGNVNVIAPQPISGNYRYLGTEETSEIKGGPGGVAFELKCPPHMVVVKVEAASGEVIDKIISIGCVNVSLLDDHASMTMVESPLGTGGGSRGGEASTIETAVSADGYAMIGFKLGTKDFKDMTLVGYLGFFQNTFYDDGKIWPFFAFNSFMFPTLGTGEPSEDVMCKSGYAMTGLKGRAGDYVDALGVICAEVLKE